MKFNGKNLLATKLYVLNHEGLSNLVEQSTGFEFFGLTINEESGKDVVIIIDENLKHIEIPVLNLIPEFEKVLGFELENYFEVGELLLSDDDTEVNIFLMK